MKQEPFHQRAESAQYQSNNHGNSAMELKNLLSNSMEASNQKN